MTWQGKYDEWLMDQLKNTQFATEYLNAAADDDERRNARKPRTKMAAADEVADDEAVVADRRGGAPIRVPRFPKVAQTVGIAEGVDGVPTVPRSARDVGDRRRGAGAVPAAADDDREIRLTYRELSALIEDAIRQLR